MLRQFQLGCDSSPDETGLSSTAFDADQSRTDGAMSPNTDFRFATPTAVLFTSRDQTSPSDVLVRSAR